MHKSSFESLVRAVRSTPTAAGSGVLFLAVCLLAGYPQVLSGQAMAYSVLLGGGHTSWNGPFVQGGGWGLPLGAVAAEWRPSGSLAFRAELGGGARTADLGSTGYFSEETTLTYYRAQMGVLGRLYMPRGSRNTEFFGEAGVATWVRTACDVDLVGGPGFFGGETLDCDDWEPDEVGAPGHLNPEKSGLAVQFGVGARRGSWGATVRYEPAITLLDGGSGPLKATAFYLAVEWVFAGVGPKAGSVVADPPRKGSNR